MLKKYVIPYLRKLSGETICSHMVRMFGIGESAMETKLRDLMDGANPTVAPYSKEGECMVRVTAKAGSEEECEALMAPVLEEILGRMKDYVYGVDCDSMERRVLQLLEETGIDARELTPAFRVVRPQNRTIYVGYLCRYDGPKDAVVLQESETIDSRWLAPRERCYR